MTSRRAKRAFSTSMDPMEEDSPQPHQHPQKQPHHHDHQEDKQHRSPPTPQHLVQSPSSFNNKSADTTLQPNSASNSTPTPTTATPSALPPPPRRPSAGTPASTVGVQGQAADSSSSTTAGTPNASSAALPAAAPSKRRRGLGVVTPNACTECRKKRAKVRLLCLSTRLKPLANSPSVVPHSAMARIPADDARVKKTSSASTKSPYANPKKIFAPR